MRVQNSQRETTLLLFECLFSRVLVERFNARYRRLELRLDGWLHSFAALGMGR
jgi:hypothetical protein